MKLLFATTNPAKIKKYSEKLKERNIELLTLKDIGMNLHVEENGKNAIENAYLKAFKYYEATKIPTIGMDNSLYIEGLPEEKQPGTHVRRVNGKELTDEEMIKYYTDLVNQYGGKLIAKWIFGIVLYDGENIKKYSYSKSHFYFVGKACEKRNPGYPLDSISIIPEFNKYMLELTEDEKKIYKKENEKDDVIDFIVKNLKDIQGANV